MSIFSLPGWKTGTFNGTVYAYLHIKPALPENPTFLFCHGFPNGVLSFRRIIPLLISQGYGVIAPEMLGYGGTEKPTDVSAYSLLKIADSLKELLTTEELSEVIVLGHDWGSAVASRFVLRHPGASSALIMVGIPFLPPDGKPIPVDLLNKSLAPLLGFEPYGYMDFFLKPEAPQIIQEHLESFVQLIYSEDGGRLFCGRDAAETNLKEDLKPESPPWMGAEDRRELVEFLQRNDMNLLLNWYRSGLSNVNEAEKDLPKRLTLPYLYMGCEKDTTAPQQLVQLQNEHCDQMTSKSFPAGHWLLEEDPHAALNAILEWLPSIRA